MMFKTAETARALAIGSPSMGPAGGIIILIFFLLLSFIGCKTGEPNSGSEPAANYEDPQGQGDTYWWHDTVFYEVFVRSFYDSDGDGIGDINGLIEKLDYLNDGNPDTDSDLGITGLWLMPVCESPSYHGYDVADYRSIETDYGTNDDFIRLTNEAHKRGIRVIVDYVINHTSDIHPWFLASANQFSTPSALKDEVDYSTWYRWTFNYPGYNGPWGQDVWHRHSNGWYYYGLFWSGMPDLNYQEPAVYTEIADTARYWLQDMQVDGFRLDAVKYIYEEDSTLEDVQATFDFWKGFQQDVKGFKSDMMSVGEAWDDTEVVKEYVSQGDLDLCFEFSLATDMINAVSSAGPSIVVSRMRTLKESYPYHRYATFLTNHDQNRVMNQLSENTGSARLAASVYLTLPGVPFIYYGEEIGMRGQKPDELIRRPMQWNSGLNSGFTGGVPWIDIDNNYAAVNVESQQGEPNSLWNRYRQLIRLRNRYDALDRGTYQAIEGSTGWVYAYLRQYGDQVVCVIHNFSTQALDNIDFQIQSSYISAGSYSTTETLNGVTATGVTIDSNGGFSGWKPIPRLEARESYIIILEK